MGNKESRRSSNVAVSQLSSNIALVEQQIGINATSNIGVARRHGGEYKKEVKKVDEKLYTAYPKTANERLEHGQYERASAALQVLAGAKKNPPVGSSETACGVSASELKKPYADIELSMRELQKVVSENEAGGAMVLKSKVVAEQGFFAHDRHWALRLTVDPTGKILQFSIYTSDGTLAFFFFRVWGNSPYSNVVVPMIANCQRGAVHYSFPIKELTRDNSPFRQGDDPYIPIRADVVKVFPPGCLTVDLKGDAFPYALHLSFNSKDCEAKYFKNGVGICGLPVFSHGFAWYLMAKYVPSPEETVDGEEEGMIHVGVGMSPHPHIIDVPFEAVRCYGALRVDGTDTPSLVEANIRCAGGTKFQLLQVLSLTDLRRQTSSNPNGFPITLTVNIDVVPLSSLSTIEDDEEIGDLHRLMRELPEGPLKIDVLPCTSPFARDLKYYNVDTVYKNFTIPKGLALVISNETFVRAPKRKGTAVDEANMRQLLMKLGYNVLDTCNDLTAEQMMNTAKRFATDKAHWDCHSCVVVVLTHGEHGTFLGSDDQPVDVNAFVRCFYAHNAPGLAGKPKIFIFQACRGGMHDTGFFQDGLAVEEADTSMRKWLKKGHAHAAARNEPAQSSPRQVSPPIQSANAQLNKIPDNGDILIAYPTAPEYVSWRNETNGSWFIRTICVAFSNYAKSEPIELMLQKVMKYVAKNCEAKQEGFKQMPCYEYRLRLGFYFVPGVSSE